MVHGDSIKSRRIVVMGILACLLMSTLMVQPHNVRAEEASALPVGYSFTDPKSILVDQNFSSEPSNLTVSKNNDSAADFNYTENGLDITYNEPGGSVYINNEVAQADTVRFVINPDAIDSNHMMTIKVQFFIKKNPGQFYQEAIDVYPYQLRLRPGFWLGSDYKDKIVEPQIVSSAVQAKDLMDIIVSVRNGKIICSVDGLDYVHDTDYKIYTGLTIYNISLTSNALKWDTPGHIFLKRLEIGQNAQAKYFDGLHKTITPGDYDFTLSMQLHADYSNPAQVLLMKQLADTYGIKGEFDTWVYVNDPNTDYGISSDPPDDAYRNALLALQQGQSGWDIGLHAVNQYDTNRTNLIDSIDLFERYFGPLKSWTDSGYEQQDIYLNGTNSSSPYYISDYLQSNQVMMWVNQEFHSHSQYDDLNYEGAYYTYPDYPGLDLLRTSNSGILRLFDGWNPAFGPVVKSDFDSRLRPYADDRAVLLWHEYGFRFLYIQDGDKAYAFTNHSSMGYPYTIVDPMELENNGAKMYPGGTWKIMEPVEYLFQSMKDSYHVWYATPQEVYQRSKLVQGVNFSETSSQVSINNPNGQSIDNFSLYTKSKPTYYLQLGNVSYYPQKGAESWSFKIDSLPANSTLDLVKVSLPPETTQEVQEPIPLATWGIAALLVIVVVFGFVLVYKGRNRRRM